MWFILCLRFASVALSLLSEKKKTRPLQDDHETHKQKGRLLFAEHIWTSLRLNIPNVTWAGNDLFTGSVVTPAKRRGGGGGTGMMGTVRQWAMSPVKGYVERTEFLCS